MRKTTTLAMEESFVPVRAIYKSTPATSKACKSRVDGDYCFASIFSFVSEELSELIVSPIASHPIELFTLSTLPNVFEVFHSEESKRFFCNLLAEAVIIISHEPSLSTAKSLEFTLSRTSAYDLEFLPRVSISSFDSSNLICFDNSVIRADYKILNAQVYPKNFFVVAWFDNSIFNNNFNPANFSMDTNNHTLNLPRKILMKIFRDFNRIFLPAFNSCKLNFPTLKKNLRGSQVVSNTAKKIFSCFPLVFVPFQHLHSIISCTLDESRREFRKLFSNFSIQGFVKLVLGICLEFKTLLYVKIRNSVVLFDSFKNLICNRNIQTDYSLHSLFSLFSIFILNGWQFIHPINRGGLLATN